ncbi:glycosyltransferase family 2 protein [Devosia geojensis]|uniref:glycosyltransferase family 2 protein n=1 Tax=Devosia geojensis TaxID=443610 RepID=UPI001364E363|nr:glycosyltransferase [Devosia geojensis]
MLRAVLAEDRLTDDMALRILSDALLLEIDPLDYCVRRLGVPQAVASARAAQWAGLAYHDTVPRDLEGSCEPARIDALAQIRSCRLQVFGRDVLFCAPDFSAFLRLAEHVRANPDMRGRLCIVPPRALRAFIAQCAAPVLTTSARQRLARRWPWASAHLELTMPARIIFSALLLTLLVCIVAAPFSGQPLMIALSILIVAAPAVLRIAAVVTMRDTPPPRLPRPADVDLPIYTILLPLRDEAAMVPQLYRAMSAIDYPPEKLDIKFVVEADSTVTIAAVGAYLRDSRFELVVVPKSQPRTKPKAMNYALPLARGEFIVVFDAEDRPAPDQLWQAAARFRQDAGLACLQAELVVDNGGEGLIAAQFAGEYAALFGLVLPAQARWGLPVPLGGTSNHFRTQTLRAIGGWDSFNVTEDADLGVRLARLGQRVDTLASHTLEEAPVSTNAWMAQRTRWVKGWMQTFIVHNRQPLQLLRDLGWKSFAFFELIILAMILAPVLHVTFMMTAGLRLATGQPLSEPGGQIWILGYLALFVLGNCAAFLVNVIGLARLKKHALIPLQLFLPIYWLLLAAATFRAVHELLVKPYYWAKTSHRPARDTGARAQAVPERKPTPRSARGTKTSAGRSARIRFPS